MAGTNVHEGWVEKWNYVYSLEQKALKAILDKNKSEM